jgi:hypothetical protein
MSFKHRRAEDPPEPPQARTAVWLSEPAAQQNGKPEASKQFGGPSEKQRGAMDEGQRRP